MTAARVSIDLNAPEFQQDLLSLETREVGPVFKTLRKLLGMDMEWEAVYRDHGLHWEQVKGAPGKLTIRLWRKCRAVVRREGQVMRFMRLHTDHDGAYGGK